jgi:hypothetical protein
LRLKAQIFNLRFFFHLEPVVQAKVIGCPATGDRISVNSMGIYGWIFSDTVTLNGDLKKVIIISPAP